MTEGVMSDEEEAYVWSIPGGRLIFDAANPKHVFMPLSCRGMSSITCERGMK